MILFKNLLKLLIDIKINTNNKNGKSFMFVGIENRIEQVIANLLDNAINYSKENSNITINFDEETNNYKLYLKISITDEGDGIEKKYINRITQRFYRVDKNRSRMQGGTGLGLAIVKHIIQRHQGELEIKSKVGIGSTFSALFPSQENIKIL